MSDKPPRSVATAGYYLVALVGIGMSADTSWLLSGTVLHLSGPIRYGLFSFVELLYLAGALGMRESVRAGRRPGVHRGIVWALSAYSAFAAVLVAGPIGGVVRLSAVVLGLVALHVALGIELRKARGGQRRTALAWLAQWHWMLYPHLAIGTVRRVARAHADAARSAELSTVATLYPDSLDADSAADNLPDTMPDSPVAADNATDNLPDTIPDSTTPDTVAGADTRSAAPAPAGVVPIRSALSATIELPRIDPADTGGQAVTSADTARTSAPTRTQADLVRALVGQGVRDLDTVHAAVVRDFGQDAKRATVARTLRRIVSANETAEADKRAVGQYL